MLYHGLQFLILQFPLQLLILRHLSHRLVEIVLIDCVSLILDGRQARLCHDIPQIRPVQLVAHLHHTLVVNLPSNTTPLV